VLESCRERSQSVRLKNMASSQRKEIADSLKCVDDERENSGTRLSLRGVVAKTSMEILS